MSNDFIRKYAVDFIQNILQKIFKKPSEIPPGSLSRSFPGMDYFPNSSKDSFRISSNDPFGNFLWNLFIKSSKNQIFLKQFFQKFFQLFENFYPYRKSNKDSTGELTKEFANVFLQKFLQKLCLWSEIFLRFFRKFL